MTMDSELSIAGINVSKDVVATIVSMAAERVVGVASVGENAITSSLISVCISCIISSKTVAPNMMPKYFMLELRTSP